ncbi:MAG: hypothetical protein HQ594_04810 [Candidatus Omnitrophica bacterium]|nr:hypothetical protein [Candidatus Omnitrophota bacterium]
MRIKYFIGIILIVGMVFAAAGCSRTEKYGKELSASEITDMKEVLIAPEKFNGKTVKVEGKIVTECPTGCWFEFQQNGGIMYTEIESAGFAIPQRVGKKVIVEGEVSIRDKKPIIAGKGVEIK